MRYFASLHNKGKLSPAYGVFIPETVPEPAVPTAAHGVGAISRGGAAGVGEPLRRRDDSNQTNNPNEGGSGANDNNAGRAIGGGGVLDDDRNLTFEQIHRKYQSKVYNLILRWINDPDDAEELTGETFINAYRNWDKFRGDAKVSTWLFTIANNCCKNRYKQRDKRREREVLSLDDNIDSDAGGGEMSREVPDFRYAPEQTLLNQELAEKIREAVEALPEEYRVVLLLDQREEISYEEIARITGLTVPAVKTRLHRARQKVRQRLEPYYRNWSARQG